MLKHNYSQNVLIGKSFLGLRPSLIQQGTTQRKINSTTFTTWPFYVHNKSIKIYQKLYYKRDDFNFPTYNVPFMSINIPEASAFCVYMFWGTIDHDLYTIISKSVIRRSWGCAHLIAYTWFYHYLVMIQKNNVMLLLWSGSYRVYRYVLWL